MEANVQLPLRLLNQMDPAVSLLNPGRLTRSDTDWGILTHGRKKKYVHQFSPKTSRWETLLLTGELQWTGLDWNELAGVGPVAEDGVFMTHWLTWYKDKEFVDWLNDCNLLTSHSLKPCSCVSAWSGFFPLWCSTLGKDACEHRYCTSCSIEGGGKFLVWLSDYQVFKKDLIEIHYSQSSCALCRLRRSPLGPLKIHCRALEGCTCQGQGPQTVFGFSDAACALRLNSELGWNRICKFTDSWATASNVKLTSDVHLKN